MSRFRFELAGPPDDAELRALLAATPMPGAISIGFRREPSFFDAGAVDGRFRQVVAARDSTSGAIVGMGTRTVSPRFVRGTPQPIGYLSGLRVRPEYRNIGLVARGYAFFKQLHADGRTPLYLTTIAADNHRALELLTSGRAGLPRYHPLGEFHTLAFSLRRRATTLKSPHGVEIRTATESDLPAIMAFFAETGPARQFFPCLDVNDFGNASGLYRGVALSEMNVAIRGGRIVGTLGVWDQRSFRQMVVAGYHRGLALARPAINLWSRLRGGPHLPRPHEPLPYVLGTLPTTIDADPQLFQSLVDAALARAALSDATHLLLGLHGDDPLLAALGSRRIRRYVTRLFAVCWDDGDEIRSCLDGRPPYLELGSL
jgi:ribosomal protein S18 acetylase RimI-like enzyme